MKLYPFILTSIAGLTTLLGTIFIFTKKELDLKTINLFLMTSSSIMIGISILDLIPSSYNYFISNFSISYSTTIVILFTLLGFMFSSFIDKKLPVKNNDYYKLGLFSMIVMIIHNIPEGIITYVTSIYNINIGIKLVAAISLHNIPEGIAISIPIYYATKSRKKAVLYTLIAALSEPLGALITGIFLQNFITLNILNLFFLIVAGLMLHISLIKIIKKTLKSFTIKYLLILISFLIAIYLLHIFL